MSKLPNQKSRQRYRTYDEDRSLDRYLKDIAETPLISADEEKRLSRRIKQGDRKALEKLTKANLRFVVSIAKQYQNQGLALSDLISEGNFGLIKAAKRFDDSLGFKFISYAVWWIRQSILQSLAQQSRIVRLPLNRVGVLHKIGKATKLLEQQLGRVPSADEIAIALDLTDREIDATSQIQNSHLSLDKSLSLNDDSTLLDALEDEHAPAPDEIMHKRELKELIEEALDTLTPKQAEVITLYFGLNGEQSLTLEEIGTRFSLTRERIRQIKELALRRLRHASRSRQLHPYLN